MTTSRNPDQAVHERRIAGACSEAEALMSRLGPFQAPIDPIAIAGTERRLLRLCPGDYKDAFDGRLEYLPRVGRFLCYYNTKYDRPDDPDHAPRTRFSLAHELGHFFIESHHAYLRAGGRPHSSKGEFLGSVTVEQQADAFAAHLLMPDRLFKPLANQGDPSVQIITTLAHTFHTSLLSTTRRVIECSDFYCAAVAVRDGRIGSFWRADSLIANGIYPGIKGPLRSTGARAAWVAFSAGNFTLPPTTGWARDWFRIYRADLEKSLPVIESYLAIPVMGTLIVLLTVPEDELWTDDE